MVTKDRLILFRKQFETEFKDITDRISSIGRNNNFYTIIFNDGVRIFAKLENVIIMYKKGKLDLDNYKVIFQGKIKNDIVNIDAYTDGYKREKYKITCKNNYCFICDPNEIEFYKFSHNDKNLLDYWHSCACETDANTIHDMLNQQYNQLNIEPSSVLYSYINKTNTKYNPNSVIICPFDFNNSQLKAIRMALGNKISIIKGPPGTGKTQTILNIICNLIVRGKTVAIISANNSAIENIETKLENNGYKTLFASLGNGDRKAAFFNKEVEDYKISETDQINIPLEKLASLSKLFEYENRSKKIGEEIAAIRLEQKYYEKFNQENIVDVNKYKFKDSNSLINYITRYQEDIKEKKFTLFLCLKLILKYGWKKSLIKIKNRNQILTSLEYKYYNLKLNELTEETKSINSFLANKKLTESTEEYKALSKKYLDNYIKKKIDFKLEFTQKDYKKRFTEFIKRYPVITSTAISFMSSIESKFMFDYVIIDESSQVPIPSIIPLLNKCKNIIIVGDDKQLSPIEKYNTECSFDNVFDSNKQSLITSFMEIYPEVITTLLEHYRCDPAIIGFCNLKYYNNQLIPFTKTNKDFPALNICFTNDANHMSRIYNGEQNGIYNQREIDVIDEILNTQLSDVEHKEIGIISPYRLQINKLQNRYLDIKCDTIHKFQGQEKNVILFSSVLDNKANQRDLEFVDNANMINVTVSRAVKNFILVTNEEVFNEKGKEIHDLINYISYKTMNAHLFKSKCVSIFDYLYQSKTNERNKLLRYSSSKSQYDSEKLLRMLIDRIIKESFYNQFSVQEQVRIKDITIDMSLFNNEETTYIQNNCSVDFLIKDKVNQDIVCAIEVDGIKYHENNKQQLIKDAMKDSILTKSNILLLRLKTNGSNEEQKIKQIFNQYLNKFQLINN